MTFMCIIENRLVAKMEIRMIVKKENLLCAKNYNHSRSLNMNYFLTAGTKSGASTLSTV